MCGICGKLNFDFSRPVSSGLLKAMADTISHRGPDDEGYYTSGPVGFGFRRLSIIDLAAGHQPIANEDGSVWIIFNGEIYNYLELREDLQRRGHIFSTQTDTEVIVHLYEEFGTGCLEKLRGMFGFAIWDSRKRELLLARDRVGIKPLYYALTKDALVFGSEIKALLADPGVSRELAPEMIDRFLTFYYMPGEETLFRDIRKLGPGCYLLVKHGQVTIQRYWDLQFNPNRELSFSHASEALAEILEDSVRRHMIADVPVGVLLSGGVDSTAILGLATDKTDRPLSSFTVGFDAPGIADERPYARLAAQTYGIDHHEMTITATEFRDFLPQYVWHMEEPVCEPPAVALYYVSKLARNYVKVLLSGEGGDEAFAGYPNYRSLLWLERLKRVLGPTRGVVSRAASGLNAFIRSERLARFGPLLSAQFEDSYFSRTSSSLALFNSSRRTALYTSGFAARSNKQRSLQVLRSLLSESAGYDILSRMLYVDTKSWLPDDLLIKADKITMANSVELRVPLLDHRVLEFAASLPSDFKVRRFTTKYIAKKVLGKKVPRAILNRRKAGFPVPYAMWLRREMKDWLFDLLLDSRTMDRGYFDRRGMEDLLTEAVTSGRYSKELFSLATLELWHRSFLEQSHSQDSSLPVTVER